MTIDRRMREQERQAEEDRLTLNLAGLALTLALSVAGLFLIQRLSAAARLEDCAMTGRSNCMLADAGEVQPGW